MISIKCWGNLNIQHLNENTKFQIKQNLRLRMLYEKDTTNLKTLRIYLDILKITGGPKLSFNFRLTHFLGL